MAKKKRTIQKDVGLRLNTPAPKIIGSKKRRYLDEAADIDMRAEVADIEAEIDREIEECLDILSPDDPAHNERTCECEKGGCMLNPTHDEEENKLCVYCRIRQHRSCFPVELKRSGNYVRLNCCFKCMSHGS